ncbi:Glycosyltransferase involved in cell wall bisynthesis [Friedmanniella luteola]|uniref:Glycosyltransferase involved in cell wall bisynthesis n=1 Tax=Friedmanniella luteola TaxID=546871 RepID=A0A1H1TK51_9ACTN|nr:glycosyltransferase [Friedmanniella luteola]SDS60633.1 Glycosyltransferase involved in cell wall bisynthesis [Friedmanniella luteola]
MRILLGADQYPEYINGAATFTARLAGGLAARGHTVDLVWPSVDGRPHYGFDAGVRVHRVSSLRLPTSAAIRTSTPWAVSREVRAILGFARPDVVHVQSHFALGRALVRSAKAAGLPVLATNHFMPENLTHHVPLLRHASRPAARAAWNDLARVYRAADAITAPTERAVQLLAAATDLPRAEAVSCGIDLDRFRPAGPASVEPATLLFVGRLEQEKHVDDLLRAFARVPVTQGARLEVVGMGSQRAELEALARQLALAGRVLFRGAVSDDELLRAYQRATVFVMPGTAELQSLATLEAMAAGCPVVAADAMALPHLVGHGDNGYLVRPGDLPGLADALGALLADAPLRRRMGAASRARAARHQLTATLTAFEDRYAALSGLPLPTRVAPADAELLLAS